ncbi:hypothetical protein BN874_130027 [Candidatus Contendobacter odensis Run_B_J11]|uniref:Uncharacterized protein n=1 Tax=Candidatus Contendobacter odensis Run_B_J11 TaxID=1400861 RepID=A0A7U7J1N8_9GAMM|nr:hypothetical protein BN874_130027 [Candidatus Contendobacter odensis Run_B_J11]
MSQKSTSAEEVQHQQSQRHAGQPGKPQYAVLQLGHLQQGMTQGLRAEERQNTFQHQHQPECRQQFIPHGGVRNLAQRD